MKLPSCYFRKISTTFSGLSQVSTGELDVQEYLNGNPKCWIVSEEIRQVKKKIIFNPYFDYNRAFKNFNPDFVDTSMLDVIKFDSFKLQALIPSLLPRLMDEGFEVYFYTKEKKLTKVTLNANDELNLTPLLGELLEINTTEQYQAEAIIANKDFRTPDEFIVIDLKDLMRVLFFASFDSSNGLFEFEKLEEDLGKPLLNQLLNSSNEKLDCDDDDDYIKKSFYMFCELFDLPVVYTSNVLPKLANRELIHIQLKSFNMAYEIRTKGPLAHLCVEQEPTKEQMESVEEQLSDLECLDNEGDPIHIHFLQYLSDISKNLGKLSSPIKFKSDKFNLSELPKLEQLEFFTIRLEDLVELIETNQLHLLKEKMPKLSNIKIKNKTDVSVELQEKISTALEQHELSNTYSDDHMKSSSSKKDSEDNLSKKLPDSNLVHDPSTYLQMDINKQVNEPSDNFSQKMISYKLKKYLIAYGTQAQQKLLPLLDKGICAALSEIFYQLEPLEWQEFLKSMYDWQADGSNAHIERLLQAIDKIYVQSESKYIQYLGDSLETYLHTLKDGEACLLSNPWHKISLRKISKGEWLIYDPNYTEGAQTIHSENLADVIKKIHASVGKILTLSQDNPVNLPLDAQITDIGEFLEHGGLDAIIHNPNLHDYFFQQLKTLNAIPKPSLQAIQFQYAKGIPEIPKNIVNGFSYQNINGIPFWLSLIASELAPQNLVIIQNILKQGHLTANLEESLKNIKKILNLSDINVTELVLNPQKSVMLIRKYNAALDQRDIQKVLVQVQKHKEHQIQASSKKQVISELVRKHDDSKTLIHINDSLTLQGFSYGLQQQAHDLNRPIFVVNSPTDLHCFKSWIHKDALGKGRVQKGFGGPLHAFLEKNKNNKPLIIIHYDAFEKEDVIRFNAILDKNANIDGYPIPADTQIIGLQNPLLPNAYLGADFSSRFDHHQMPELKKTEMLRHIPNIEFSNSFQASSPVVYLYQNTLSWKKTLLGYWIIQEDGLRYQRGVLSNPLPQILIINNGPWEDSEFTSFWQQAIFQGYIEHEGERLILPENFCINPDDSYNWQDDITCVVEPTDAKPFILNPTTFYKFFEHQAINPAHGLSLTPGIIADNAGNILPIYVTRNISQHLWAKLLAACKSQAIQLSITLAPGVVLPEPIKDIAKQIKILPGNKTRVVETNDIDASLAQEFHTNPLVIDVSELSINQLWSKTTINESEDTFNQFLSVDCVLKQEMENPQFEHIILKGKISPTLQDNLAEIILEHPQQSITLMVQEPDVCQFLQHENQNITLEDKTKLLVAPPQSLDLNESICKIQSRMAYPKGMGSDNPWQGSDKLDVPHDFKALDLSTCQKQAQSFQQQRFERIDDILSVAPYVFLTGLSGVGKSTFVQQVLSQHAKIFYGEQALEAFAKDDSDQAKILFIDEANLKNTDWTILEGLYQLPPYLLVDGQQYPVNHHKLVFAGNPCSYGDERHLPEFIARHGNCLVFEPLPTANIYEEVLKPCFQDMAVPVELCQALIVQYQFLIQFSKEEILISPRELQMIVLLTIAYHHKHPTTDITHVAKHFAHRVLFSLVPKPHQQEFLNLFPRPEPLPIIPIDPKEYLITNSRISISQQLLHYLELREFRRASQHFIQQYGGLGGIIIEGESGIGKSELVIHTLVAQGFTEGSLEKVSSGKTFYKIPVSMSTKDKEVLLLKAFDEGSVVIVDEINSAPMMEHLLNDLLMGRNPDGKLPQNPGFTLIGTQNPMSMGGRKAQSTALSRRLQTLILPDLPPEEKIEILCHKGLGYKKAQELISQPMNFRNLLRCASHLIEQQPQSASYLNRYSMFEEKSDEIDASVKATYTGS